MTASLPARRVQQVYQPADSGVVLVYAGDLELTKGGSTWLAAGDLELHLGAESRLVAKFAGHDAWLEECLFGERPTVSVPHGVNLAPPADSAVPSHSGAAAPWATLELPVNHLSGGDASLAERFVLHVAGSLTDYPLPAQPTTDGDQGQLVFTLQGWDIRLAKGKQATANTGFATVLEAVPQAPADADDVTALARRLFMLMSFVAAKETGVAAITGLDQSGQVVWATWGAPRTGSRSQGRWCPERLVSTALPALADGLSTLAADPGFDKCIDRAIGLWLAANGSGVLDVRVPMVCSGLDLLSWSVLQHRQWLTTDGLGKLSVVASRTRLLLHWAGIPVELPSGFAALIARRRSFGPADGGGPELIFEVRNRVVHPPKKFTDPEWPSGDELFEAWQLAMRYTELVILRVLGYRGEYSSRLQLTGWEGETEQVPWSKS